MRLRTKTIAVIGLMLVVVLLILYPLQQWWMTNSFAGIEQQDVRSEINHTINGINYDLMTLRNVSSDYASWDDTYFFVQDGDEQYARA
ncbi:MAG TPA: CHASE4 domain-containing protein, partial [Methanocella sp.]|nr:CHASE4 domain-containing protein [Methanocella sp.]